MRSNIGHYYEKYLWGPVTPAQDKTTFQLLRLLSVGKSRTSAAYVGPIQTMSLKHPLSQGTPVPLARCCTPQSILYEMAVQQRVQRKAPMASPPP